MEPTKGKGSAQTRQRIRQTFVELYLEKPFGRITVNELVEKCYISRGTFYTYYTDTVSLLSELEDTLLSGIAAQMDGVIIQALRGRSQGYVAAYARMLEYISAHSTEFQALLTGSERASFLRKYRACIAGNTHTLLDLDHNTSPELWPSLCAFHGAGVVALLEEWLLSGMQRSPIEIAQIVYNALFCGLLNHPGEDGAAVPAKI